MPETALVDATPTDAIVSGRRSIRIPVDDAAWALVLAAGQGTRLRSLTTTEAGTEVPKQFCSLRGGSSLLHEALDRARALTPDANICCVVAAQHQQWWLPQLGSLLARNVIVQSQNRGTANGILLPLLLLHQRDPGARIIVLPSDHHVRERAVLARSMRQALAHLQRCPGQTLLLGFEPEESDPQLGYIVPGERDGQGNLRVLQFIEKPTRAQAHQLISRGALWNAFIMASTVETLLALFMRRVPEIVDVMCAAIERDLRTPGRMWAVDRLYEALPIVDFSRDILAGQSSHLRLLPVPMCGWSDLGTPERVAQALRNSALQPEIEFGAGPCHLSLAAQQEQLRGTGYGVRAAG
jgi:mannose-1-phosphate guanylyltransferase